MEYIKWRSWTYLTLFSLVTFQSVAQDLNYFDHLPDLGGKQNQAQGLIVLADTNEIFMMGDLVDSTLDISQDVIRPFLSRFDYEGNLIASYIISDSLVGHKFHIDTRPIIKDSSSILIYIDVENNHFGYDPCLLRIDLQTGKVLEFKTFENAPTIDSSHVGEWSYRDNDSNLVAFHYLLNEKRIFIRVINKNNEEIKSFLVEENHRWNAPKYIHEDTDSTYVLVGTSVAPPGGPFPESKIFFMRINQNGKILDFKLAPDLNYNTISFTAANSFTVLQGNQGEWFISVGIVHILDESPLIYSVIPITMAISSDFDSMYWINYFSQMSFDTLQFYHLTAATWAEDKSGYVVSGYDFASLEHNSFISKFDVNGEQLWSRKYNPTGWDDEDFAWANIEDIKSTPYNTYVAAGMIFDNINQIRRPWILHIDSVGCIVPGCDITNVTNEEKGIIGESFLIYPNPSSDQIYILLKKDEYDSEQFNIYLSNSVGQRIKTATIIPSKSDQFIFSLYNLPSGNYIIEIWNKKNKLIQTERIIKK